MIVVDMIDQLRGKFQRCRNGRSLEHVAGAIGISEVTLSKFLAGEDSNTKTLRRIEQWCDRQEYTHGSH